MNSFLLYQSTFKDTDNLFMSIHRSSDDNFIGTLTTYVSIHYGTADMDILIGDRSTWCKGYGLDAWVVMSDWLLGQKDIRKLTADTMPCNFGMIKLMERSDMTLEATRTAQEMVNGCPVGILYYAKFHEN